ncbi:GntR family transcriptional regulator [Martelella endophytica]|uniref:Transcriptional regulator n=1 Tax=Martelella endophytica TaxID=1486262 RepID=A0A0D5LW11_MAREN|nr:GntR family transcriptional regulator [Martelella endophytica]AJY47578.1 transcriptional regulator [Martelella endophytica]
MTEQQSDVTSVRDTAYDLFQHVLMSGRLRPGQMVSQRALVDMLNLSIGALRELLPRLQAEGLVNVLPQRGVLIPAIDLPMIRNAFQMRGALEREAVIQATRTMPDAVIENQRRLHLKLMDEAKRAPSPELFEHGQEVDAGFHNLLIASTGNALLQNAYNINAIRIRLIKLDRIKLNEVVLPQAFSDHIAIIDALLERDPTRAVEAMDRHIHNARERALQL